MSPRSQGHALMAATMSICEHPPQHCKTTDGLQDISDTQASVPHLPCPCTPMALHACMHPTTASYTVARPCGAHEVAPLQAQAMALHDVHDGQDAAHLGPEDGVVARLLLLRRLHPRVPVAHTGTALWQLAPPCNHVHAGCHAVGSSVRSQQVHCRPAQEVVQSGSSKCSPRCRGHAGQADCHAKRDGQQETLVR